MPKGIYERTAENAPKPRQYPQDIVDLACGMYEQGMTVAEIRAVFPKGYRVQTILERHLDYRRACAKREQSGEKNHMWKGDSAGYSAAHLRLQVALGRANEHACSDCDEKAADWSYCGSCPEERNGVTSPPYCVHPEHYKPRCTRCHHHYDSKGRRPNGQLPSRWEVMSYV